MNKRIYIVTVGGILIGYTDNRYIVEQITSDSFDKYHRNQVAWYDDIKSEEQLKNILKEDYFAEDNDDCPILDYYRLSVFECFDMKESTITSQYSIRDNITGSDCLEEASHALIKSFHDLSLLSKYINDPTFSKLISYIMMKYSRSVLTWQTMGMESPHIDKIKLLLNYGYLNKL